MTCIVQFIDDATGASLQVVHSAVVPREGEHVVLRVGERRVLRVLYKFNNLLDVHDTSHPTVIVIVHNRW